MTTLNLTLTAEPTICFLHSPAAPVSCRLNPKCARAMCMVIAMGACARCLLAIVCRTAQRMHVRGACHAVRWRSSETPTRMGTEQMQLKKGAAH